MGREGKRGVSGGEGTVDGEEVEGKGGDDDDDDDNDDDKFLRYHCCPPKCDRN